MPRAAGADSDGMTDDSDGMTNDSDSMTDDSGGMTDDSDGMEPQRLRPQMGGAGRACGSVCVRGWG